MDNSFMPQPFSVTTARRRQEELARQLQRLDGAARTGNATVPAGSTLELEGGINVPGGYIIVRDKGEVAVIGEGTDRYTGQDITVTTSFGNREVEEPWTGISVLRPGIWLESSSYPADPANLASLSSRYGDNIEIRSLEYDDGGGGRWRSAANIDPAGASLNWSRQEGDPSSPTTGGTTHSGGMSVSIDSGLFLDAYSRYLPADNPDTIGTYGALTLRPWGGQIGPADGVHLRYEQNDYDGAFITKGLLKFDKDGAMSLHSEKGSKAVDVTHNGDGVLRLKGSDHVQVESGMDVQGPLTVNGSPVGGGGVTSINTRTGAVTLTGSDIPAASTSAQGAMAAADKTALDRLNTDQILAPLTPSGWTVEGDFYLEPVGAKQKAGFTLKCIRTGAAIAVTAGTYVTVGTVIPTGARSTVGVQTYSVAWLLGGSTPVLGTVFVNPNSGQILFTSSSNMTFGTNFSFTISHTYTK